MLFKTRSAAVYGIDAHLIDVEVDFSGVKQEQETFSVVGLPDAAVRESRDRVRSAIKNSGFDLPPTRITINLAPADLKKEGSGFDLPIAIGILGAYGGLAIRRRQRLRPRRRARPRRHPSRRAGHAAHRHRRARTPASATSSSLRPTRARPPSSKASASTPSAPCSKSASSSTPPRTAPSKPNRSASRRAPCSKRHWITSPTSATSAASTSPSARSKSPPPAATTSS